MLELGLESAAGTALGALLGLGVDGAAVVTALETGVGLEQMCD